MTKIIKKILEKLVHRQLLNYLLENEIINEDEFGFFPSKSTHEAILSNKFNSALNSKKTFGYVTTRCGKYF